MELIILLVLFVVLILPTILMARKNKQRQQEVAQMQANLSIGQHVVTAGGVHGVVNAIAEETVDVEIAPKTVITVEKITIVKVLTPADRVEEQAQGEIEDRPHPENDN